MRNCHAPCKYLPLSEIAETEKYDAKKLAFLSASLQMQNSESSPPLVVKCVRCGAKIKDGRCTVCWKQIEQ